MIFYQSFILKTSCNKYYTKISYMFKVFIYKLLIIILFMNNLYYFMYLFLHFFTCNFSTICFINVIVSLQMYSFLIINNLQLLYLLL